MAILDDTLKIPAPVDAICDNDFLTVSLSDGRQVSVPLWWYPRLQNAAPQAREKMEFMPMGIHWPDIDEDVSVSGLLNGAKAPDAKNNIIS